MGLGLLHIAELPRLTAQHGGIYFLGAWVLCLFLLSLPVVLTQWMLGRRAGRAPIEGMAVLTREADAKRGWRASAWGMMAAALLAMALVALVTAGSANTLVQGLELVDGTVQAAAIPGWILPTVAGLLLLLAAGLALLPARFSQSVPAVGLLMVLVLLALPAIANMNMFALTYPANALSYADWRMAAQMALLATGAGLGVFWVGGVVQPAKTSLGRMALLWVLVQALLGAVLVLTLVPYVAVAQLKSTMAIDVIPTGFSVWMTQIGLLLLGVLLLTLLLQPLAGSLRERGLAPLVSVAAVVIVAAALALGSWATAGAGSVKALSNLLPVLLALVLAGQSIFAGWVMKVSHARKALNLPSEGIYNLWRVAARLLVPLALVWVLVAILLRAFV